MDQVIVDVINKKYIVAIDASRNRSGGARAHIFGILNAGNPRDFGIDEIHLWSYKKLLDGLPDYPWLVKHNPIELERGLPSQLYWQYRFLPRELSKIKCDILLSTDGGSICHYPKSVVMSRCMLSFEAKEMQRYGLFSLARLRLFILRYVQISSFRRAQGVLFLTNYASNIIQAFTGKLQNTRVIPHGISDSFRQDSNLGRWRQEKDAIECVYVSNTDLYKHQWHVVRAIRKLRDLGYPVCLRLVGGLEGKAAQLLNAALAELDPLGEFVELIGAVKHSDIPKYLAKADIFIFASSCENMPNTLIEAMASGIPIACSDRGPMPEILNDGGVFFNPEDPVSIADALEVLLKDETYRSASASRAKMLSEQYSWARCARETWTFLSESVNRKC